MALIKAGPEAARSLGRLGGKGMACEELPENRALTRKKILHRQDVRRREDGDFLTLIANTSHPRQEREICQKDSEGMAAPLRFAGKLEIFLSKSHADLSKEFSESALLYGFRVFTLAGRDLPVVRRRFVWLPHKRSPLWRYN